ncbi:MAG: chitobiase/beta-hexosaminidase C-terminal domain-containing protein [Bacteroidales bacterium]|nr:chitobiase/beta-hexosaminidase C-terminal domain-containing protein [Bacteroidales bacterium]
MDFNEIPARRNLLSRDMPRVAGDASEVGIQYGPYVLMYYRELFPFPEKQISLNIYLDAKGQPFVSQTITSDWQQNGAIPLLIEASLNSNGKVYMTPCANLPLMRFTQPDPYVLRFSNIGFSESQTDNWLRLPPPMITTDDALFRDSILVTIESIFPAANIYYTLDGTEPSGDSFPYTGPFYLERSTVIKARSFDPKGNESEVSKAYCHKRSELIRALEVSHIQPGLQYSYYEGDWRYLPDFEAITPVRSGTVPNFDIHGIHTREDNFAIRFRGYIDIPQDGMYTFYSRSDDGTKIYIGDLPIVDNDGTHGPVEESGDVNLQKEMHNMEVQYFESTLGQEMYISYEGPGISKAEIPGSVLFSKQE